MRDPVLIDRHSALGDQADRFGENDPFCLLHDAALQNLGRIALLHLNGLLQEDRSVIKIFIDKMNCCARHFRSSLKDFFVNVQTVIPFSAERRDQRRVDIDDPSPESVDHAGGHRHHKTCKDDKVRLCLLQTCKKRIFEQVPVLIVPGRDAYALNPRLLCAGKRIGVLIIADDADDLRVRDLSASYSVDDRLEIRSPARYTNGNSQHNSTPFCAPLTVSPIT